MPTKTRTLIASIGLWVFPIALTTLLLHFVGSFSTPDALKITLRFWAAWSLCFPVVLWVSFRFPLESAHLLRNLAIHSSLWLFIVLSNQIVARRFGMPSPRHGAASPPFWAIPASHQNTPTTQGAPPLARAILDSMLFVIIITGCQTVRWARLAEDRKTRALKAEAQLAKSQLTALQLQLNPHFLFNALNGLNALINDNPKAAEDLLEHLSQLLRKSLALTDEHVISLRQEIEFLDHYLAVEETRFQDRLHFSSSIEPNLLDALVPTFILQPLIENAIKHGIESRRAGGEIHLKVSHQGESLYASVSDNGRGLENSNQGRKGIGLANTRQRLNQLYPGKHEFSLSERRNGGCVARIEIPLRFTSQPKEAPSTT